MAGWVALKGLARHSAYNGEVTLIIAPGPAMLHNRT